MGLFILTCKSMRDMICKSERIPVNCVHLQDPGFWSLLLSTTKI